jgi:putative ABC transport system permease protein
MTTLLQDISYGCRMLLKKPGFAIAAVLSVALGIGANTTIFSVINGTILRALSYSDPHQLMILWNVPTNQREARQSATAQQYLAWKNGSKSFASIGGYYGRPANLGGDQGTPAEAVQRSQFTYSMWDLLGVKPVIGRVFTREEDQDGKPADVAILSHRLWQRRFGGSPSVLGQTVMIDGATTTIIGVMPPDFDFFSDETGFWSPMGFSPQQLNSIASFLLVAGRLKEGATSTQAQAEMDSIAAGLREASPERNRDRGVFVEDIRDALTQGPMEPLMILQGAVVFVLLIACSNVASLLLARASARRTEVAVRTALGAGRRRVIRQLLTESILLALAGGAVGALLGWAGVRMILSAVPPGALPVEAIDVDGTVLGYTAAISILTGLIFGIVPALQTSKVNLTASLKESGRTGMDGSARQRLHQVLVTAQIALALVLLIGAGLMMNTFLKLRSNDLGANPYNLLSFEFRFPQTELMKPVGQFRGVGLWEINSAVGLTYDRLYQRLQAIPGVTSVSAMSRPPLTGTMRMNFNIAGRPAPDPGTDSGMNALYYAVTPNYFATLEVPLVRGRDFAAADSAAAVPVVIISKAMADRWWPNQDPIGQQITLDFVPNEVPREIVGVVGDTKSRFQQRPEPTVYVPQIQQTKNWQGPFWNFRAAMYFVLRTPGDPNSLIPSVKTAVNEIDATKPAGLICTVDGYLNESLSEVRVFMMLLAVFGASAAVLAATGIYGVMAYAVAQRTREIGVRVALGASSGNILGLVVRQTLVMIAIGVGGGLAGAYGLTRFLRNYLWQVSPTDPMTFAVVSIGLVLVAVIACLIPTRRAVSVDPTVALRYE